MRLEDAVADDLEATRSTYVEAIVTQIRAEVPTLFRGPDHAVQARAGVEALLTAFVAVLRRGAAAGTDAPEPAVAFAREHARADTPLVDVLRSYRVGQQAAFDLVARLARDPADLARVGALAFRFADVTMAAASAAYEAERERRVRQSVARRDAVVERLLAGAPVDRDEAERVLGRRLDGDHHALVPVGAPAAALAALADVEPHALVTSRAAWVRAGAVAWDDLAAALAATGRQLAVGEPGGLRDTYRQAVRAAAVADRFADEPLVFHADVAFATVLLADRTAAAAFAHDRVGALHDAPVLRRTLRAWLDAAGDQSAAAAALGVHRNTVRRRLAEAERLSGGRLPPPGELDAALRISALLG